MARSSVALLVVLSISVSVSVSVSVLPALAEEFLVEGCVYCDTCQAGFETNVTTSIEGATVRVQCKDRDNMKIVYSVEAVTGPTGTYNVTVKGDHKDQICECVLLSCSCEGCNTPDPRRNTSTVVLTRSQNGILNNVQRANSLGCLKDKPLAGCKQLIDYYLADV